MNQRSQLYFLTLAFVLALVLVNGQSQNKTQLVSSIPALSLLDRLRGSISRPTSTTPSTIDVKPNKITDSVNAEDDEDDDNDDDDNEETDSDDSDDDEDYDLAAVKSNKPTALAPSGARFIGLKTFLFTIKAIILGSLLGLTLKDALIRGLIWAIGLYVKHLLFPNILSGLLGTGLLGFG